ncbi:MAG: META domain-containing protein [Mycobacterium sp.]|nr:META domain-containing protein [Mycobacterium sp.]
MKLIKPPLPVVAGVLAAAVSTVTAGCSSPDEYQLEGITWQLVSIQSMDDAQGTTAVPDPRKFTVTFGEEGQALFQLDCNRGTGSYTTSPIADGSEGGLEFGPIATTMMMCPQPSLDEDVGAALPYVRTFIFRDGMLHMSKLADGGILSWKRA